MALKKTPNPTYKHSVEIPVPGEKPEKVEFTFRYMSESEYKKLRDDNADMPIVDFLGLLIADWGKGASEEFGAFSVDALREVADAYPGAPHAIHSAYVVSRYQGRTGN